MMAKLMIRVSQVSLAYSERYTAVATPNGTENISATTTSQIVPKRAGKIPPAVIPLVGALKRNSKEIFGPPL